MIALLGSTLVYIDHTLPNYLHERGQLLSFTRINFNDEPYMLNVYMEIFIHATPSLLAKSIMLLFIFPAVTYFVEFCIDINRGNERGIHCQNEGFKMYNKYKKRDL